MFVGNPARIQLLLYCTALRLTEHLFESFQLCLSRWLNLACLPEGISEQPALTDPGLVARIRTLGEVKAKNVGLSL